MDSHDAVFRDNEAPVNKYAKYVGVKRDFRLVVRGAARNMLCPCDVTFCSGHSLHIIKSVTHRNFDEMIKTIPNPVYLSFPRNCPTQRCQRNRDELSIPCAILLTYMVSRSILDTPSGKYSKSLFAISLVSKAIDYFNLIIVFLETIAWQVIRIHSPMRSQRKEDWSSVSSRELINRAHAAALRLQRSQQPTSLKRYGLGQLGNCKVWGDADPRKGNGK
ncbi:hypothetical protein DY000_02044751 [Brassica cretica]|uniref:Uncharacterized protein n=1 Tax=Brassica cretica TaxID=69181 RepID=A0ABQ7EP40_BRACR|nr:hypothetical protein DY000_02044751 [Brassica cretica]